MKLQARKALFLLGGVGGALALLAFVVARPQPPWRPASGTAEDGFAFLGPPQPGEWRHRFHELAQSFEKYRSGSVNRKSDTRKTFYLQPLGGAGERYAATLERMRRYAAAFFGVPAKLLPAIPLDETALHAERGQYLSTALIRYLADRLPNDTLVLVGITEKDLFAEGLNFVFGQGSLTWRCGVYSLHRFETPDERLFTRRSLDLLAHESGHILSIEHCVTYACVMEGANTLRESDQHPMHLCPIDLEKVLWNTGMERKPRYRNLLALYREWGLAAEADWVEARLRSP